MNASDLRVPHARWIVVAAATAVCAVLLWATRNFTFYFDEWSFITTAPAWTFVTLFEPHNEHPVMLLRLLYAALLHTAGMRSYVPYMAAVLLAHLATAVLLFELVRRRAGDGIALACAAVLLVLGGGWENVLWAFQVAFVASTGLGLGALLAAETGHPRAAALLVALGLAFSGIGLFFAAAVGVRLLLDPGRRREAWWLLPVALALAAWYAAFGRAGTAPGAYLSHLATLPAYVGWGLAQSAGALAGITGWAAVAAAAAATAALAFDWTRRRPDGLAIGAAVALISFYAVTGLSREQLGYQQSAAGRYVYVGAVLWLVLLAGPARRLPWRATWRPALAACVFLACFNSSVLLFEYTVAKTAQMQRQVADLQALAAVRHDSCLDPSAGPDPLVMPYVGSAALYYRAVDAYGDPVAGMPLRDRADYDAAVRHLCGPLSPAP